jgi:hypothetical protein
VLKAWIPPVETQIPAAKALIVIIALYSVRESAASSIAGSTRRFYEDA